MQIAINLMPNWIKFTPKAAYGEQVLKILLYKGGFKTELYISCWNLPTQQINLAKLFTPTYTATFHNSGVGQVGWRYIMEDYYNKTLFKSLPQEHVCKKGEMERNQGNIMGD